MKQTKAQQKREALYRAALRRCGFRSWRRASRRRTELVKRLANGRATVADAVELRDLERLTGLYSTWKTNDSTGWRRKWRRN